MKLSLYPYLTNIKINLLSKVNSYLRIFGGLKIPIFLSGTI